jgi:hypothetical protein
VRFAHWMLGVLKLVTDNSLSPPHALSIVVNGSGSASW